MTKKLIIGFVAAVVFVSLAVFGGVNWLKAAGNGSVVQNIQNWYGNVEAPADFPEEGELGAIEMESGRVTYSQLSHTVLQRRQVVVSAAQVDDLRNVPIVLIPAVGDSNLTVVDSIVGFRRFSSESWGRNYVGDSFEIKWGSTQLASGSAPGMANSVNLGASFSQGFFTGNQFNSTASPEIEIWRPGVVASQSVNNLNPVFASSSAVYLTGAINPNNVETSGITDFVFEVIYRVFPRP